MLKQLVTTVLADWSFWDKPPRLAISREIQLPKALKDDLVLIIQGVRRCGKSTLLSQLPAYYNLNQANCFYCNFEDPRLIGQLNHQLLTTIVEVARQKIKQDQPCYFFLDEIQNVDGWEKWLHIQLERPRNNHFVITGSNSYLLSGEFATALTGRHNTLELFPFSFSEYLELFPSNTLTDYLESGGFPRPLSYEQPKQLLQEYFNDIILRDVAKRVNARAPDAIKQVVKMTFDSCGSELSYRKIAAITELVPDTVKSYLEACEQAYLIFPCPFFAFSEKKRLVRKKKYYPIDTGLRNAVVSNTNSDLGKNLELLIYLSLRKCNEAVYYWQELNKGEVDFVTVNNKKIIPYQVTWGEPQVKHERSLDYFYAAHPQAEEAVYITHENASDYI